jgi:hypothetical protein
VIPKVNAAIVFEILLHFLPGDAGLDGLVSRESLPNHRACGFGRLAGLANRPSGD